MRKLISDYEENKNSIFEVSIQNEFLKSNYPEYL
jgi:hypothetical protein